MCSYCWGQYDPNLFSGHPLPNSTVPVPAEES